MRLVLLGPPGAGKGTQARWMSREYSIPHLSTGDMFREAIAEETSIGRQVQPYVSQGKLVPDEVTVTLVAERLRRPDCAQGYLLDGFPRTLAQAQALDARLGAEGKGIDAVIAPLVDEEQLVERLSGRRVCPTTSCRAVYHVKYDPPKRHEVCDRCGAGLVQREDDRPETIRQRLRVYHEQTAELADYYRRQQRLCEVDGRGTVEEVQQRLMQLMKNVRGRLGF